MTKILTKYYRTNEECNWQIDEVKTTEIPESMMGDAINALNENYKYSERYDEWWLIHEDKLHKTKIRFEKR